MSPRCLQHSLYRFVASLQSLIQLFGFGSAASGHVRATPAFASDKLRNLANDLPCIESFSQIVRHPGDQRCLAVCCLTEHHHARLQLLRQRVCKLPQSVRIKIGYAASENSDSCDFARGVAGALRLTLSNL